MGCVGCHHSDERFGFKSLVGGYLLTRVVGL